MNKKKVRTRLEHLLRDQSRLLSDESASLSPSNRIFTNRNIKLTNVSAIGFDMDFTLVQYNRRALDQLTFELTLKKMIENLGYPPSISEIPYNHSFAIRGLVIDIEQGNVLKIDKFHYVGQAYHGLVPLKKDQRRILYRGLKLDFRSPRFRAVDTLFELVETYIYSAIIEYLEKKAKHSLDYSKLFVDIRNSVDLCHRDGSLKNVIMRSPEIYIDEDPLLISTLHKFKTGGKRLFVVTNSEAEYTTFMLSFIFRHGSPFFRNWRSCFELVYCKAQKPKFFVAGTELNIIENNDILLAEGGHINDLEQRLGASGDHILYVGDHIYGDILKTKRVSSWRTCMILPELPDQVRAEEKVLPLYEKMARFETARKRLDMKFNLYRNRINALHEFKEIEADDLTTSDLHQIDGKIKELNRSLERVNEELSVAICEWRDLREHMSRLFNPFWGRLFQTRGQLSALAEQIRDYACIYTSSVGNFSFYSIYHYFRSAATLMPHESELLNINLGELGDPVAPSSNGHHTTLDTSIAAIIDLEETAAALIKEEPQAAGDPPAGVAPPANPLQTGASAQTKDNT